jgi:hypothetical protein
MCGLNFCSLNITQDVREYTNSQKIEAEKELAVGMGNRRRSLLKKEARFIKAICPMGR